MRQRRQASDAARLKASPSVGTQEREPFPLGSVGIRRASGTRDAPEAAGERRGSAESLDLLR